MSAIQVWRDKGYVRGKSHDLLLTMAGTVPLDYEAAQWFKLMEAAARRDGITLRTNSGFRSMAEQTAIYNERLDPAVKAQKGPAARPGFSDHQSGIALDIQTGISFPEFQAGKRSPVFDWLTRNARSFGFTRDAPSEPWHWVFHADLVDDRFAYNALSPLPTPGILQMDTSLLGFVSDLKGAAMLSAAVLAWYYMRKL